MLQYNTTPLETPYVSYRTWLSLHQLVYSSVCVNTVFIYRLFICLFLKSRHNNNLNLTYNVYGLDLETCPLIWHKNSPYLCGLLSLRTVSQAGNPGVLQDSLNCSSEARVCFSPCSRYSSSVRRRRGRRLRRNRPKKEQRRDQINLNGRTAVRTKSSIIISMLKSGQCYSEL